MSRPADVMDAPDVLNVCSLSASVFIEIPSSVFSGWPAATTIKPQTDPVLHRSHRRCVDWCTVLLTTGHPPASGPSRNVFCTKEGCG